MKFIESVLTCFGLGGKTMQIPFFLSQIGTFVLGITFGYAVIFNIISGRQRANAIEGFLMVVITSIGVSITLFFYVAAFNLHL